MEIRIIEVLPYEVIFILLKFWKVSYSACMHAMAYCIKHGTNKFLYLEHIRNVSAAWDVVMGTGNVSL